MSFDPYDVLGVPPTATPEQFKAAYRRASSRVHPDKGGTTEQMQEVNKAYEIVSDPIRKARWDAGEGDAQKPEGDTPRKRALRLFNDFFTESLGEPGNVVAYMQLRIDQSRKNASEERRKHGAQLKQLQVRRDRIKAKEGVENLMHQIIDGKCEEHRLTISLMGEVLETLGAVETMLKDYESDEIAQMQRQQDPMEELSAMLGGLKTFRFR